MVARCARLPQMRADAESSGPARRPGLRLACCGHCGAGHFKLRSELREAHEGAAQGELDEYAEVGQRETELRVQLPTELRGQAATWPGSWARPRSPRVRPTPSLGNATAHRPTPGEKKAVVGVCRSILIIAWHLLSEPEARFYDLGSDFYDNRVGPQR
jgi:hypothetical protein